jgi:hypothetical protein
MVFISNNMRYKVIYTILSLSLLGIIWNIFFSYASKTDVEIAQILGVTKAEIESFDYSESWNLQDYDIVEKYKLSNNTIQRFLMNSSFILYDSEYETDSLLWGKSNWTQNLVDSTQFSTFYEIAFGKREDSLRNKWISEACESLKSQNGFCSFYYKKLGNAVAFYVLDIKKKTLYVIYLKV